MTNALEAGINPADLQKFTGADMSIITKIYHHLKKDAKDAARSLFNDREWE